MQLDELKTELKNHKDHCKDLETAVANVTAILSMTSSEKHKSLDNEL